MRLFPLRIVMWTAGVSSFAGEGDHRGVWKKVLTHPCIVAMMIGLVRMALAVPVPDQAAECW